MGERVCGPWTMVMLVVVVSAAIPTLSAVLTASSSAPCTIVAAGDIAASGGGQSRTADIVASLNPTAVLTLGDNAYPSGSDSDFQAYYESTWGRFKAITRAAVGNHEYATSGATGYFGYFGVPPYYAYDLCGWHLYSLNPEISGSDRDQEVSWLRADLAAHHGQPMLAVWHEPRWSSGTTHGSDEGVDDLWQAVVAGGVRVVLNGHEHSYERFAELDGQGRPAPGSTREIVVGEGGAQLYPFGSPLAGSQARVTGEHGVLSMTLRPDGYDWRLLQVSGTVADQGSQHLSGAGQDAGTVTPPSTSLSASPVERSPSTSPVERSPSTSPSASPPGAGASYWWLKAAQASYVKGTEPATVFGTSPELLVDAPDPARHITFLTFDLSVVPAGATVVSGRVFLRATTDITHPVDVYAAPSGWSQARLSWNTQPIFTPRLLGRIPLARAGDWVSIDVGPILRPESRTGSSVSLALTCDAPGQADARFASDDTTTPPTLYLGLAGARMPART